MSEIILSICMVGRNDKYSPAFKRRFQQSINFLAYSAKKAGLLNDIEVLFTDWNSDIPLHEELRFSKDAAKILKFIIVPPKIAEKHNWNNTPFHTTKSHNVAIRRARGKFIGYIPGDVLIPSFTIEILIKLLRGEIKAFFDPLISQMAIPRKWIPTNFPDFSMNMQELSQSLSIMHQHIRTRYMPQGSIGASGMFIVSAVQLRNINGINEKLGGWGHSDTELSMRLGRFLPPIDLNGLGMLVYDFAQVDTFTKTKYDRVNDFKECRLEENDYNWGLGDYQFNIYRAKSHKSISAKNDQNNFYSSFKENIFKELTNEEKIKFNNYDNIPVGFIPIIQLFPRDRIPNFIDIGFSNTSSKILSSINQFSNLYFFPCLNKNNALDVSYFRNIVQDLQIKHMGILRCISARPNEVRLAVNNAFGKIKAKFDLIRYNCDYKQNSSYSFYKDNLANTLIEGGSLIVYGKKKFFKKFSDDFVNNELNYSFIKCDKYNIGVFLKVEGKTEIIDDKISQEILERVWGSQHSFLKKRKIISILLTKTISLTLLSINKVTIFLNKILSKINK